MAATGEEDCLTTEDKLFILQLSLQEKLSKSCKNEDEKLDLVYKYLDSIDVNLEIIVPEFPLGLNWLNTSKEITMRNDLSQKVVVLDFFTYCCINCMHILPDLHSLEELFPSSKGLAVIGVHSAKFENEKVLANVADAVLRYNICHPVVNDPQGIMWNELQIQCWPSLLILGPGNQLIFKLVGENYGELLRLYCKAALNYYQTKLSYAPLPIKLLKNSLKETNLLFPGKVAYLNISSFNGPCIAIADTGHHRILLATVNGVVQHVIGTGKAGFSDGTFETCAFHSPQGVVWKGTTKLYVADTENHSVRMVDLICRTVSTVVGNGKMGGGLEGGRLGTDQQLNSPWDLFLYSGGDANTDNILFIAMAGSHQIWAYFLDSATLLGKSYKKGLCISFAGSGVEENRNNSYPSKAGFAQPSGISIGKRGGGDELYVADSESSSIRCISLLTGAVRSLVGGDRDPKYLFAFGDKDGVQYEVRLQHPLGVAWCPSKELLYVADTYNHKIKMVDVDSRKCETLAGSGKAGHSFGPLLESQFNEPGGLCTFGAKGEALLVADTNNHSLKIVNLLNNQVEELPVVLVLESAPSLDAVDHGVCQDVVRVKEVIEVASTRRDNTITLPKLMVSAGDQIILCLNLTLASGFTLTQGAPHNFQLQLPPSESCLTCEGPTKVSLDLSSQPEFSLQVQESGDPSAVVRAKATVFVCEKSTSLCYNKSATFSIPVERANHTLGQKAEIHRVILEHTLTSS